MCGGDAVVDGVIGPESESGSGRRRRCSRRCRRRRFQFGMLNLPGVRRQLNRLGRAVYRKTSTVAQDSLERASDTSFDSVPAFGGFGLATGMLARALATASDLAAAARLAGAAYLTFSAVHRFACAYGGLECSCKVWTAGSQGIKTDLFNAVNPRASHFDMLTNKGGKIRGLLGPFFFCFFFWFCIPTFLTPQIRL